MKKMAPLVDFLRPRFDALLPVHCVLDVGHAAGSQHSHHLNQGNLTQVFSHDEVHQIVDVRQPLARPLGYGNAAVKASRPDVPPSCFNLGHTGLQPLYEVSVADAQCRRELAVSTTKMDDKTAPNTGVGKNAACPIVLLDVLCCCAETDRACMAANKKER